MRIFIAFAFTTIIALSASPAPAAEPIGAAVVIVKQVTASLGADARTLQNSDNVHQDELIEVSADGLGELKLNDATKVALGPGSKLLLDKFVYDPNKSSGAIAVNLMAGTFRFITGVASKPSYVVRVPQASITVRGTIFDVYVQPDGVSWLLLLEGAVKICDERGQCRVLEEVGKLVRVTDTGIVEQPTRWAQLPDKTTEFDLAFPFVQRAPQVDPTNALTREAIVTQTEDSAKPSKKMPKRSSSDRKDDDSASVNRGSKGKNSGHRHRGHRRDYDDDYSEADSHHGHHDHHDDYEHDGGHRGGYGRHDHGHGHYEKYNDYGHGHHGGHHGDYD